MNRKSRASSVAIRTLPIKPEELALGHCRAREQERCHIYEELIDNGTIPWLVYTLGKGKR